MLTAARPVKANWFAMAKTNRAPDQIGVSSASAKAMFILPDLLRVECASISRCSKYYVELRQEPLPVREKEGAGS